MRVEARVKVESCVAVLFLLFILGRVTDAMTTDVLCDSSGMHVHVRFKTPFKGIIYSKGYQNETICRYLPSQRMVSALRFYIPVSRCGTETVPLGSVFGHVNTVVFQNNPVLQTSMDHVVRLTCDPKPLKRKAVTDTTVTLESSNYVNSGSSAIKMEIKKGKDPLSNEEVQDFKVGDQMIVVIRVNSETGYKNARVINCEARDAQTNQNATVIKLLDSTGCPLLPQIFSSFEFIEANNSQNSLFAFSRMTAFRFNEKSKLFLSCDVEICRSYCLTCINSSQSNKSDSVMSKSEITKRSRAIPGRSTRTLDNELEQRKLNDSTVRRVMKQTVEALSLGVKQARLRRRLKLKTAKIPLLKRRDARLEGHMIEESEPPIIEPEIPLMVSDQSSDEKNAINKDYSTPLNMKQSPPATLNNTPLPNLNAEKNSNAISSSAKSTVGINVVEENLPQKVNLTVSRGLSILPARVIMNIDSPDSELQSNCSSPVKFTVIISCLLFLVLCLLTACILLTLKIKRMNRNNAISRFLLYPYN